MTEVGPVEYMIVSFPGNRFTGQIAPALAKLIESNTIRVIDLAFVSKDADGAVASFELSDLDEDEVPRPLGTREHVDVGDVRDRLGKRPGARDVVRHRAVRSSALG